VKSEMNLGGARAICGRGHCDDGRRLDGHPVYYRPHCDSRGGCSHESGHAADDDGHERPGLAHVLDDVHPDGPPVCLSGDDPRGNDPGYGRGVVDMARPGKEEADTVGHLEGKAGIQAEAQHILCSQVPGTPAEDRERGPRATQRKGRGGLGVLAKEADIHTEWAAAVDKWAAQDMNGEGEEHGGSQKVEV
jgi:hypothetical protein